MVKRHALLALGSLLALCGSMPNVATAATSKPLTWEQASGDTAAFAFGALCRRLARDWAGREGEDEQYIAAMGQLFDAGKKFFTDRQRMRDFERALREKVKATSDGPRADSLEELRATASKALQDVPVGGLVFSPDKSTQKLLRLPWPLDVFSQ